MLVMKKDMLCIHVMDFFSLFPYMYYVYPFMFRFVIMDYYYIFGLLSFA